MYVLFKQNISVSEVIMEGDIVKGVVTEAKSGRAAIMADVVVDCTGDADVAYLSGARVGVTTGISNMVVQINLCTCVVYL